MFIDGIGLKCKADEEQKTSLWALRAMRVRLAHRMRMGRTLAMKTALN